MRPEEATSSVAPKRIFLTWLQTMTVMTPGYRAAVHRYAALPDLEDVPEVVLVAVPLGDDVVDSGADDSYGQHPEDEAEDVVAFMPTRGALLRRRTRRR